MTNPLALIIEDNEKLADIYSLALQAAEFDTEIIHDGKTALARLAEIQPVVVILDLHLPRIVGKSILHHIRADERLAKTRVILATADAATAEELQGKADLVLLKPISVRQLRDLAKRLRPPDITVLL
jgi:DNA-binding response OmpR family regulator